MHRKWRNGQVTNFPHEGGCRGCAAEHRCNSCGLALAPGEGCTNGRCRHCHTGVCTGHFLGHGYGHPSGRRGEREAQA